MGVGKGNLEPANNVSAVWLKHGLIFSRLFPPLICRSLCAF
ncbi:hypothetical protein Hanom_Chr11g01022951 [Helianthus anomalus]